MNFRQLEKEIYAASKAAFTELVNRSVPETICSFALYSDEGAMTVCPAADTDAHLAKTQKGDSDFSTYYKFSPAEWKYESEGADEAFTAISRQLAARVDAGAADDDESEFAAFRTAVFGACANTLVALKEENFFELTAGRAVMLLFTVSDADITARDIALVKILNDTNTANDYEQWARSFNDL